MTTETARDFPGLSPAAFQHPLDIQATTNLQKIPLLPMLLKQLSSSVFEKQMRLMNIAHRVRLGPNQGRSVYDKFTKAARILDLPELPEVYVSSQYVVNATAFGLEKYQITLYAGLIDYLTEEELLAVIGHELGHVKCEHMLYKTMAYLLRFFGAAILNDLLPAGTGRLATISLQLAILNWERMAELSCDRAALLVVQDREVVASALSKLAGGSKQILPEINLESILEQAQEYDESEETFIEKLFKVNMLLMQTHPFPIVRVKEIMEWGAGEQYERMMGGDYVHYGDVEISALALGQPMSKVCPNCQRLNAVAAMTCATCNNSLKGATWVCTNCQIKVFPEWQTCPGCGSDLQSEMPKAA